MFEMSKIRLLIGIHNHQPVGNFDHVFSEAYDKCYLPMLETLAKRPDLRFSVHHSGPLLEWLEKNEPSYVETLAGMVESGQVEMLSGGFYEPILSSLTEKDAVGQVEMMNRWIEARFGVRPRGAWLAERIWDPSMPQILAAAGIEFTLLDDTHFYYAGLGEKDMYGYWVTEKHGHSLAVFPIDKTMRYSIPFKQPEESLKYFRETAAKYGTTGITYGDDGEKLGVWPETHEWVFGKKWLERFLTMLEENKDVVETTTFSKWMDAFPPKGRIYLPMASYEEMMHWTLPPDVALEHMLVDSCSMRLIQTPTYFDVVVTENTFGDILSDEAAVLAGSLGLLPSASLGDGPGLYEPIHGSAPPLAGKDIANPIGTIASAAMLLRYSLRQSAAADAIDTAVQRAVAEGARTRDIARDGEVALGTRAMADRITELVGSV
jgi:hypothetical protein